MLNTLEFCVFDAVLCFNDGMLKYIYVLHILGVRNDSNTVKNAVKQIHMDRICKIEIYQP